MSREILNPTVTYVQKQFRSCRLLTGRNWQRLRTFQLVAALVRRPLGIVSRSLLSARRGREHSAASRLVWRPFPPLLASFTTNHKQINNSYNVPMLTQKFGQISKFAKQPLVCCTVSQSSPLCLSRSSGLPSLQLVKLWPTCIFACRPLLLELSSLQRAQLSFHHLIQTCLKNIPVPLEYAYSTSETILLFDRLYKCTI